MIQMQFESIISPESKLDISRGFILRILFLNAIIFLNQELAAVLARVMDDKSRTAVRLEAVIPPDNRRNEVFFFFPQRDKHF